MRGKILVIAQPFPGVWDAGDAISLLTRAIRSADRSIANTELVSLPWLDGAHGTIDFLVTNTLGSFLEVETKSASGEDIVVPMGFAGENGTCAVIEMSRVARVNAPGEVGTTAGIGELIQDALDEGAFSILLCHSEPLARDAGLGAASALGVKFFDAHDQEIDFFHAFPTSLLERIARVDISGRAFALLSSRIYIARWSSARDSFVPPERFAELARLAEIILRDTGIRASITNLSASAVEFGLGAFLGAEVRDGTSLVLEASQITDAIQRGEFSEAILFAPSMKALTDNSSLNDRSGAFRNLLELVRARIDRRAVIVAQSLDDSMVKDASEPLYSLSDVPLFQAPIGPADGIEAQHRNLTMRLEKVLPIVLAELRNKGPVKEQPSHRHHA